MITTFYPPFNFGGDGRSTQRLASALAERGHQVDIIYLPGIYRLLAKSEPDQTFNDHPNVRLHAVETAYETLSLLMTYQFGAPFAKSTAIQEILKADFDVIHYHNISLFGPAVLGYGRAPVKLYTFHEYWLICPTHILYRYNQKACESPRFCQFCTMAQKRPPQLWRYTNRIRNALKHIDSFISPSEFTTRKHLDAGLDIPIVQIPNFISPFELVPEPPEEASGNPYFLYVGNLNPVKGVHLLKRIFEQYKRAKLIIIVEGSPRPDLEQSVSKSDGIVTIHRYSDQQLSRFYQHATALIVPSLGFEISSQVIMEAAARRTPVIARNIGAVAEFVNTSGAGLTYSNEQELPAILDRMLDDEGYRYSFGEQGHQAYKQQWTVDKYTQRYFELIDSIQNNNKSNHPTGTF